MRQAGEGVRGDDGRETGYIGGIKYAQGKMHTGEGCTLYDYNSTLSLEIKTCIMNTVTTVFK